MKPKKYHASVMKINENPASFMKVPKPKAKKGKKQKHQTLTPYGL
jgi:hypothetical protein